MQLKTSAEKKMTQSSLIIKREIDATPDEVYLAWKNSDLIRRWVFPMHNWTVEYTNDFRVSGEYHIEFTAEDGDIYAYTGKYLNIIPNEKIVFTWILLDGSETIITLDLHDKDGKTEIVLSHEAFPTPELRNKYHDGWQNCLNKLEELLHR